MWGFDILMFKIKDESIPKERIKKLLDQFGLLSYIEDEYDGTMVDKPYRIHFEKTKYENKYGTKLILYKDKKVILESIFFNENILIQFLYKYTNIILKDKD